MKAASEEIMLKPKTMKKQLLIVVKCIVCNEFIGTAITLSKSEFKFRRTGKGFDSALTLRKSSIDVRSVRCNSPFGNKKFNWWSEALHGLANNDNVTVFPEPIGMAASFDDELLYQNFQCNL